MRTSQNLSRGEKKMKKIDEMCLNFVHLLFAKTEQEFCKYYPKHHGRGCWNAINGYTKKKRAK